jgi:hypothetical protein
LTSMSAFTYRQKTLAIELVANVVILIAFLLYLSLYRGAHNFAPLFLFVSWYFPILYGVLKVHTTEDTRTDERDRDFENRGRRDGYGFLSFGVWMLLCLRPENAVSLLNQLLIVWILSQLVVNGKQLRLYAGHESWLPDSFRESQHKRSLKLIERLRARRSQLGLDRHDEGGKQ